MLVLLLIACKPAATPVGGDDTAVVVVDPTFYKDVRPILDQSCARCHTTGGLSMSFDDPATAVGLAGLMKDYTQSGYMPPPAPDPTCRDYQDSDRFFLTDADKATIAAWADAGAPLGDEADAPVPGEADPVRDIGPYDYTLVPPVAYAPDFSGDRNDYRCFLLDIGNTETVFITGAQALVDNDPIVHHIVLFTPSRPVTTDDGSDPHDGFACDGLGDASWSVVTAWGPGANPTVFPEGMGMEMAAGAQVILQMHYYNASSAGEPETDQTGYGLNVASTVEKTVLNLAAGPTSFTIPAGDESYQKTFRYTWRSDPVEVLAVWPHMHLLGSGFDESIRHADGGEDCVLHQDGWSEEDQVVAAFIEPVILGTGDMVKVTCTWDNSATNPNQTSDPPVDVGFGEHTDDEMCFGFTYVAQ